MWDKKNYIVELKGGGVYQQKTLLFNNISFNIQQGEFVYLFGSTGSGKSSLLKLLYGELPLEEGDGRVFDFNLNHLNALSRPILRRRVGILSHEMPLLPNLNVAENLDLVLMATDWEDAAQRQSRIGQVLDLLKLNDLRFVMQHELTKAEEQRVKLARAILNQPSLLLIDEPTAQLDTENSEDLLTFLYSFAQATDTAVLFATHNAQIPEQFPGRILRCSAGKVTVVQNLPPPVAE